MSSTPEGRITIKDVLRETANDNSDAKEVGLDDKIRDPKQRRFTASQAGRSIWSRIWVAPGAGPSSLVQRLAIIAFAVCIGSIVFLTLHSVSPARIAAKAVDRSAGNSPLSNHPVLTSDQQALVALMPATVGDWTRNEQNGDLWNVQSSGGSAVRTSVSTYRDGTGYVEFWAVKAPSNQYMSQLQNFAGGARAVHTDAGVVYIKPVASQPADTVYLNFDYSSAHPNDPYSIVTSLPSVSNLSHTISWYQSPYVVTVAARTVEERNDFFTALGRLPH
jgi:hypothetical protein